MKRWVFRIVLLLLIGAIINVAVAWWCAYETDIEEPGYGAELFAATPKDKSIATSMGCVCDESRKVAVENRFGVTLRFVPIEAEEFWAHIRSLQDRGIHVSYTLPQVPYISCGLPFRTVSTAFTFDGSEIAQGFKLERNGIMTIMPVGPLWFGLLVNTAIYGSVLWLLATGPCAIRRWRRLKRDLCPTCAYPIGASDTCTECGTRLRRVATTI